MDSISSILSFFGITGAIVFFFVIRAGYQISVICLGEPEAGKKGEFWLKNLIPWVALGLATSFPNGFGIAIMAALCIYVSFQFTANDDEDVNMGDVADVKRIATKMVLPLVLPAIFGIISALISGEFTLSASIPDAVAKVVPVVVPIVLILVSVPLLTLTTAINRAMQKENFLSNLLKRL